MIIGLNVPTTYRISSWLLGELAHFGFTHVRVDVPPSGDLRMFVDDYIGMPVTPLFLLHDVSRNEELLDCALSALGPANFWIQVFNPDLERAQGLDLQTYIQGILAVHRDSRARGFTGPILMGGTANPDVDNRNWLSSAMLEMPADVWVDEHRYAYRTQDDWSRPWPRYVDRNDENRTLQRIAGTRPIVRTEFGWHTAVEQVGWGPFDHPTQLTDEQATENYIRDFQLYESDGVKAIFVFQINDGPTDAWSDRQGIRDFDGRWKPQASAVLRWKELHGG